MLTFRWNRCACADVRENFPKFWSPLVVPRPPFSLWLSHLTQLLVSHSAYSFCAPISVSCTIPNFFSLFLKLLLDLLSLILSRTWPSSSLLSEASTSLSRHALQQASASAHSTPRLLLRLSRKLMFMSLLSMVICSNASVRIWRARPRTHVHAQKYTYTQSIDTNMRAHTRTLTYTNIVTGACAHVIQHKVPRLCAHVELGHLQSKTQTFLCEWILHNAHTQTHIAESCKQFIRFCCDTMETMTSQVAQSSYFRALPPSSRIISCTHNQLITQSTAHKISYKHSYLLTRPAAHTISHHCYLVNHTKPCMPTWYRWCSL